MHKRDYAWVGHMPIIKAFLYASFILTVGLLVTVHDARAESITLTFSEYPSGTHITDQYRNMGIEFSGIPDSPIIGIPDYFGVTDPALLAIPLDSNWGSGSLIIDFVDPDTNTPVEAMNVNFYFYWLTRYSSSPLMIIYYDLAGNIISQVEITDNLNPHIPTKLHRIVIDPTYFGGTSSYFYLDNLTYETLPPPPALIDPGPCTEQDCGGTAGEPINLLNGDVSISETDYSVPGLAGGLSLSRTWNSLWNRSNPPFSAGMFGRGWTSDFEERLQTFNSTHTIYWRGTGNTWIFEAPNGCTTCTFNLMSPPNQHASLQYNSSTTQYTIAFANGTKKVFSNSGRLLATIDRNGNQTTVSYDGSNRITNITASGGQGLTFTYGDSQNPNQVTGIQDAVGTVATLNYINNNLNQVVYSDSGQINYSYDADSNIVSVTDGDGKILETHTYDTSGRGLTSSRANSIDLVTVQYPSNSSTILTDSAGNTTSYSYSTITNKSYLTAVQGPGCNSCGARNDQAYTLDGSGNRLSVTDANGNLSSYTYDSSSNILTKTNAAGTWTYTYNGFGEVLTATDPLSHTTTNVYDAYGNLTSVTEPSPDGGTTPGPKTQFLYDSKGQLTKVTDPSGNVTTITYNTAGLISTIKNALKKTTTFGYDGRGNRTSIKDSLSQTTSFEYDARNRLTKVTYPGNSTQLFAYDSRGRRISSTDGNSRTTHYGYDDADRLIWALDAANHLTGYFYDNESNLTSIVDALSRTTSFEYDSLGRVTKTTFPSTLFESYGYDNVGNLTSKTDRNGQTFSYTYDPLNRMTQKAYGSYAAAYNYDSLSRLTQASDPTGTYQFVYDSLGRLTQTITDYAFLTGKTFTLSYGYDAASNRTSMTDPDSGVTTYAYNALNLITSLTDPGRNAFSWTYDAIGRRTKLSRPNSVATSYSYDSLSRLLSISHAKRTNTIDGATYTVDAAGNRTSRAPLPTGVPTSYDYDEIYQLITATQNASAVESYTYDEVGNRLSSLGVSPYTYNASNELTSKPDTAYSYDNNGNLLSESVASGTTGYVWDAENRLMSVTLPGSGGTVNFQYDPFGRRIYKSSASATTIYVYDGSNILEEVSAAGSLVARYTQSLGIDEPLGMLRGSTMSYYQADGLGSITSLSDTKGALVSTYQYDSFGNLTASTGSVTNPFRYTGREFDAETGHYYHRARYYDPQTGRFIGEDPIGFNGGINLYAYVGNNPIGLVDPFGLESQFPAAVEGLDRISKMKCSDKCIEFLTYLAKKMNMDVKDLISNIRKAASASKTQLYDGPTSTVPATEDIFGKWLGDAKVVGDKFSDNRVKAMSSRSDPRIWLRSGQWDGWLSAYSTSKNTATPQGMGILMDELLHKKSVGGFYHPQYNADQITYHCFR